MPSNPPPPQAPLQTSRPWLTVAGCLGGGVMTVVILLLVLVVVLLFALFPDWLDFVGRRNRAVVARVTLALGELAKEPALRVATREIAVEVEVELPTKVKLRPWIVPIGPGVDLTIGATTATVRSPSNIVQYVVPFEAATWTVQRSGEDCVIVLPPPKVDDKVVEVQTDPGKIEIAIDRDWADHIVGGDEARNAALAAIRRAVVDQASSPVAMFEVREKSRKTVAEMIRALVEEPYRPKRIVVRWSDEPALD